MISGAKRALLLIVCELFESDIPEPDSGRKSPGSSQSLLRLLVTYKCLYSRVGSLDASDDGTRSSSSCGFRSRKKMWTENASNAGRELAGC